MKYLGAQSGMGFLIIKAWRIQFSCVLFVYNNPIPSVSIRRWNTTPWKFFWTTFGMERSITLSELSTENSVAVVNVYGSILGDNEDHVDNI